jgi:hypothetical protein
MDVAIVPNRSSCLLFRRGRVAVTSRRSKNRMLARLSDWPPQRIKTLERHCESTSWFQQNAGKSCASLPDGHVAGGVGYGAPAGLSGWPCSRGTTRIQERARNLAGIKLVHAG